MQKIKKLRLRIISYVLLVCMLIGVLSQTTISLDTFTNNIGAEKTVKNIGNEYIIASEYSELEGRAKQELIVKYKDGSKNIDLKEKSKNSSITSLKSKEKLDVKLEVLEINSKDDIGKVIEVLQQDPNIEYVQPNYEVNIMSINDPHIGLQWGVENTGQSINNIQGTAGADINLLPILDIPTPNEIIVAVIDTGVEITHADLTGKIHPDGWNFVGGNNNITDLSGHGTQIAGIIGAAKNNIGVMGAAQNVKILPLKVIENGIGYTSDVIEAIQYAESKGANIANCSFGSTYFNLALYETMSESDMLFVCAAGNTGTIANIYPAAYELGNVLSVTSIDNTGLLASSASYGWTVDIAAPGVDIYSTSINNTYTYGSGSSYAAAFASGAAARLLGAREMTTKETSAVLKQGVKKKNNLTGYVKTDGMLNISGSYDLIKDGQEIVIGNDYNIVENYDETIKQILEDNNYSGLTEEEKEYLCEYLRISRKKLEECVSAGYSLKTSVNYSAKMGRFGFTLKDIVTLYNMYEEDLQAEYNFDELDRLIQNFPVSINELEDIKELMLSGYKASNIIYTYIVSKVLNIPIKILVKKDQNVDIDEYTTITSANFTDDEKRNILKFSLANWVDIDELINYMIVNSVSYNELVNEVYSYGKNILVPLSVDFEPKKYSDAPFAYRSNSNERISLNSGSVTYENVDAVLPGKNGMDLVITTRYDSSKANIQDTSMRENLEPIFGWKVMSGSMLITVVDTQNEALYIASLYVSMGYSNVQVVYGFAYYYFHGYIMQTSQSNYDLQNDLGIGWELGFSYIEIIGSRRYLHLSDGAVHTINAGTLLSTSSNLDNYPLLDIQILQDNGTFTNGQVSSYYILKYKNGVNEYFSSDGRLLGRKDRFGNTIKFEHTQYNGKWLITKITDTLNRIVTISYPNTTLSGNAVITLPDNSKITYVLEKVSGYYDTTRRLAKRTDQMGRETIFTYTAGTVSEKFHSLAVNTANKNYFNLTKVTYPTGASTEYTYTLVNESIGTDGSTQMYKVQKREDKQSSVSYNVETYVYSGSYTVADKDTTASTYTYSTTVTSSATGKKVINTFNKQHLSTNVTATTSSNVKLWENLYTYNSDKQVIKNEERTYNANGSAYQTAVNNYTYDSEKKNNIVGHWSPLAGGNTASTEYKTTYAYNATYNYITSKQYKQGSNKTITEEYTPITVKTANDAIGWKKVYETAGTGAKTIKEATQYLYDSFGNVTEERRYYGNLTTLSTYAATKTEYTYNSDGTSALTVKTESVKDADGQLVATTGSGAGVVTNKYEYDKMGRVVKSTDGKGYITTYQYDLIGRQTRITNPDNTFKACVYETTSSINALTETNEKGTVMKYFYNGFGNITSVRDISSGTDIAKFTYDSAFRVTEESTLSASSTNGSKTAYTYDALDRVLTKTASNANNVTLSQETCVYDVVGSNRVVTQTVKGDASSPDIKTTTYTDNTGRVVKQGYFIGTTEYTDDYTYDYVGNRLTAKTAYTKQYFNTRSYTNAWEYDYANRVTREYDTYGKYSSIEYNALGQKVSSKDPKANDTSGSAATYEYDTLGRMTVQTTPFEGTSVSKTKYYYDNNNNVTQQKVTSNAIGASEQWTTVGYEYNNRNMLTKVTNYNLNGTAASYAQYYYDAVGNTLRLYTGHSSALTITGLDSVSGTVNSVTKYEYDALDNLKKLTDPMGYVETYTYDLLGNMLTKTDRNGKIFAYTYDGLGRLLNTKNGTTVLEEYTYTLTGNKRTESNGTATLTYTYDSLGRLTKAEDKNLATSVITTKNYTYDVGSNKLTSVITVGSTTTNNTAYTYDEASRMKTVKEASVLQNTYNYDVNGNRSSMVYANGVTTEYTYNLANMVKTLTNKKSTTVLSSYTYAYQLDGNQTSKSDHTGKVTSYVYDGLGRLTSESEKTGTTVTFSLAYQYDASNNRTKMTANNGTVTAYVYDKNNRLTSTTETAGTTITTTTYSYDKNGNTLTKMSEVSAPSTGQAVIATISATSGYAEIYEYDLLNRMVYSNANGAEAAYKYRADGLRFSKTVGSSETIHIWDGANIVGDVVNGVVGTTYVRGINLIASKSGSMFTYYEYNGHGDVVQLASASGTVNKTYDYDAFGNERSSVATDTNTFRYCGEYFDKETGTVYLRARYYNAKLGRFTQQDGWFNDPLSLNLYIYCLNNPLKWIDPSGFEIKLQNAPKRKDYDRQIDYIKAKQSYDAAKQEYDRAIDHLTNSKDGIALYEKLKNSDEVFTIEFNDGFDSRYDYVTKIIHWDSRSGFIMKNGASQSAALLLGHEFGHVAQYLDGELGALIIAMNKNDQKAIEKFKALAEAENIKKYETPIAKKLGEPTRSSFNDYGYFWKMENSAHFRTTHKVPFWEYYTDPLYKNSTSREYVVNHNVQQQITADWRREMGW